VRDPRNNLYAYAYDALSRLIKETNPETAEVNLTRDGQDDVVSYQDPRSITTSYVRNGFGEVIREVSPDAGTTTYVRDERGLVTQMTDGRGVVENRSYDNAGRQLTSSYPADTAENVAYAYDATSATNKGVGRLTSVTDQSGSTSWAYDTLGRVTTETRVIAGKSYATAYGYNKSGRITSITYPSGRIVTIARSTVGRVTSVVMKKTSAAANENVATAVAFKPMSGLVSAMTHGNNLITTAAYDNDYRLTSLTLKNGAATVSGTTYAYADGLNITGITNTVTAANSNTLAYSLANRLTQANGPWGNTSYSYDLVGNRLTESNTLTGVTTARAQSYDTLSNRLTQMTENSAALRSYTYDGNGNTLTETRPGESFAYSYNKRNRLTQVTRNSVTWGTYSYNALEQLVTRSSAAPNAPVGTIHYIYDTDGHLIAEADGATGATLREYIWLPANDNTSASGNDTLAESMGLNPANDNTPPDLPLAVIDGVNTATPTTSHIHADHLGRPIRMTNAAKATVWQATWKPWGEPLSITGSALNNLRFPGQYFQIETGLHYNHHRQYDPVTGRYTQPDPLGFVDGPSVYAYAKSKPSMITDRLGLSAQPRDYPHSPVPPRPGASSGDNCQVALTVKECLFLIQCFIGSESGPKSPPTKPQKPPIVIIVPGEKGKPP
jgi:RHS repeat-associated protein